MIVLVLDHPNPSDEVLEALISAGVSGLTIMETISLPPGADTQCARSLRARLAGLLLSGLGLVATSAQVGCRLLLVELDALLIFLGHLGAMLLLYSRGIAGSACGIMALQSPLDWPFDTTFGLLRVRPAAKPVETSSQGCLLPALSTLSRLMLDKAHAMATMG